MNIDEITRLMAQLEIEEDTIVWDVDIDSDVKAGHMRAKLLLRTLPHFNRLVTRVCFGRIFPISQRAQRGSFLYIFPLIYPLSRDSHIKSARAGSSR